MRTRRSEAGAQAEAVEPDGLGHELLIAWAPWARDDRDESHSWSVQPRLDPGYHGDPPAEFFVVDKIVAPHRRDKTNYWHVVGRYYLGESEPRWIAKELDWSVSRVLMNLCAFSALVEREYRDFVDIQRRSDNLHFRRVSHCRAR